LAPGAKQPGRPIPRGPAGRRFSKTLTRKAGRQCTPAPHSATGVVAAPGPDNVLMNSGFRRHSRPRPTSSNDKLEMGTIRSLAIGPGGDENASRAGLGLMSTTYRTSVAGRGSELPFVCAWWSRSVTNSLGKRAVCRPAAVVLEIENSDLGHIYCQSTRVISPMIRFPSERKIQR